MTIAPPANQLVCYFISDGSARQGPFSLEALGNARLTPQTLVWRQGMSDWQPAAEVAELQHLLSPFASTVHGAGAIHAHDAAAPQPYPRAVPYATPVHLGMANMPEAQKFMYFQASMKSAAVAYVLWFFLGMFGAHRFYLGRTGTATAILATTIASILLMFVLVGLLTMFVPLVWVFVDLFLIPGMTESYNRDLAARLG